MVPGCGSGFARLDGVGRLQERRWYRDRIPHQFSVQQQSRANCDRDRSRAGSRRNRRPFHRSHRWGRRQRARPLAGYEHFGVPAKTGHCGCKSLCSIWFRHTASSGHSQSIRVRQPCGADLRGWKCVPHQPQHRSAAGHSAAHSHGSNRHQRFCPGPWSARKPSTHLHECRRG